MATAQDVERGPPPVDADRKTATQNVATASRKSIDATNKAKPVSLSALGDDEKSPENGLAAEGMPEEHPSDNESESQDGAWSSPQLENFNSGLLDRDTLGERILTLHRLNLFHAEATLYKYLLSSIREGLSSMEKWDALQRDLDRYEHAKNQYLAAKDKKHSMLPSFGGYGKSVLVAANALNEIDYLTALPDTQDVEQAAQIKAKLKFTKRAFWMNNAMYHQISRVKVMQGNSPEAKAEQTDFWIKRRKKFLLNTKFAVFGGLTLIVPMLIMTLHQTLLTTLLTTSLFVFAIAEILAAVMDTAEPKDIVGATAAYAAVLVVFIGTGGGTGGGTSDRDKHTLSNGVLAGIVVGALLGATLILTAAVEILELFGPNGNARLNTWWTKWRCSGKRRESHEYIVDQRIRVTTGPAAQVSRTVTPKEHEP